METLLTGPSIGKAVKALFTPPTRGRRVVITAYIGADPVPLLGDVTGVEVYCSPSPTGTSAVGVRRLMDAGATVYFSKNLHMKVYWVEGRGALIGSANLSHNGLAGGLAEVLMSLPDTVVPIDELIKAFKHEPEVASNDSIGKLQADNDDAQRRVPQRESALTEESSESAQSACTSVDFPEWYRWFQAQRARTIKLGRFDRTLESPEDLVSAAKSAGFWDGVDDFNTFCKKSIYQEGDWILLVRIYKNNPTHATGTLRWLYTDGIWTFSEKQVSEADLAGDSYAAWQGQTNNRRAPPFELTSETKAAIIAAWSQIAPKWIKENEIPEKYLGKVPPEFFTAVAEHYKALTKTNAG